MPFIEDGLDAGEPVMVAADPGAHDVGAGRPGRARGRGQVRRHGPARPNPARIIPAWQEFLDRTTDGRPVRGIGEPIWPGRRPEELIECQLHEALLNVAVDPEIPFWLICPYDAENLSPEVIEEAHRSHPVLVEADSYPGSGQLRRATPRRLACSAAELEEPAPRTFEITFDPADIDGLEQLVMAELLAAGLAAEPASHLATAIDRLAVCSLNRGAGVGRVRLWRQPDAFVCEVADDTVVHDLLLGRRVPFGEEHDGLWLANQLCDLVQLRSTATGTTVRVHAWR